jgi:hypothetical protein
MATYIELVNKTIRNAGVELDELTSGNFASPSDPMYVRFKEWVADAWFDEQLSRKDWEFTQKIGQMDIRPRILIKDGDRATAPPVDSVFEGDTSSLEITVKAVTLLSGSWSAGTAEAILDLDTLTSNNYVFGETFDESDPTPANVDVFKIKWYGTYDLITDTTDSYEVNKSSFYILDPETGADRRRLRWVSYEEFQNLANQHVGYFGVPVAITETPDGTYDLYPRPNKQYRITYTYTTVPQLLDDETDEPVAPVEYHDVIVWRALMNYADYDEKPQVFARAERRYNLYKNRLNVNKLPELKWGANRYDECQF